MIKKTKTELTKTKYSQTNNLTDTRKSTLETLNKCDLKTKVKTNIKYTNTNNSAPRWSASAIITCF